MNFPADDPIDNSELVELHAEWKEGDHEAGQEIIRSFIRLFSQAYKQLGAQDTFEYEEWVSYCTVRAYTAMGTYDPDKGDLAIHIFYYLRFGLLDHWRKLRRTKDLEVYSIDDPDMPEMESVRPSPAQVYEADFERLYDIIRPWRDELSAQEKRIFDHLIVGERKLKTLAEFEGVSYQRIGYIKQQVKAQLLDHLKMEVSEAAARRVDAII